MKKYGLVNLRRRMAVLGISAAAMMFIFAGTAMADENVSAGGWMNMEKGPSVARWVDAEGNVSEQPGVRPDAGGTAKPAAGETTDAGGSSDAGQSAGDVTGPAQSSAPSVIRAVSEQEVGPGLKGPGVLGASETADEADAAIDPAKPMVALTFDDGPHSPVGNRILDCLAQYGAKATFYVVGNRCASYPEEMQRIVTDGHEIGNHTYSHKYLNKLGAAEIQSQIQSGADAIQATAGVAPATVRLPGGNKNATVLESVNAPMIMWSIDTLDWKTRNAQSTIETVLNQVKDGDIVLMHELYSATADATLQLVPALIERGYQLVTVSEMAAHRGGLENGKIYYNFYP